MSHTLGPRVAIFGCPLDTANLGVSALSLSTITGLQDRLATTSVTLFDNGRGVRPTPSSEDGRGPVVRRGAWYSRRVYRTESLLGMHVCSRVAPWANANIRVIDRSDAVLDLSGGDSFTDLYGTRRFHYIAMTKEIALRRSRPLLLMPQTYGPFNEPGAAERAADILARATRAWARDAESFERLRALLADRFDAARHLLGADVAFALRRRDATNHIGSLVDWLDREDVVGLNVSGLLYNHAEWSSQRFGLRADYPTAMHRLVRRLLDESAGRVVLVPHVRAVGPESDDDACHDLAARIGDPKRVAVLPPGLGADTTKDVIARVAWFSGARMHSTIAALSSGVPAAAMAYSDKFHGVFAGCGLRERVLDIRELTTEQLVEAAVVAYRNRHDDASRLAEHLPAVQAAVADQFDEVAGILARAAAGKTS